MNPCLVPCRELLLNNNLLRVLPYELGRLFQLQTLGIKGEQKPLRRDGRRLQEGVTGDHVPVVVAGNPLSQDILNLYQEPDGTRKLLNYMLDNLAGKSVCSGQVNRPAPLAGEGVIVPYYSPDSEITHFHKHTFL